MRAMEEEGERMNPVNPKKAIKQGATSYASVPRTSLVASGATPSMGLSQFRGGGKLEIVHHGESDDDAEEAGGMLASHIKGLHGAGYLKKFHSGLGKHCEMDGGMNTGAYEGSGRSGGEMCGAAMSGGAAPGVPVVGGKAKRAPSDARKRRGALMSRLMKEKGMSLGEASKYIKEHGL